MRDFPHLTLQTIYALVVTITLDILGTLAHFRHFSGLSGLGLKKEDREKSDQRILGSGDFVSTTLQQSERILEKKYLPKRPIEELIEVVGGRLGLEPELICSGSRQKKIAEARALVAYLTVEETGHKATDVARILGIKRVSVHHAAKKGKKVLENLPSPL